MDPIPEIPKHHGCYICGKDVPPFPSGGRAVVIAGELRHYVCGFEHMRDTRFALHSRGIATRVGNFHDED